MGQGRLVRMLQFAAQRNALREARKPDPVSTRQARDVMRRGFALDSRVGCHDHLFDRLGGESALELIQADILGPDPIERRQSAEQHEIAAIETGRLLDRQHVAGGFDHAQDPVGTTRAGADIADVGRREISTAIATPNFAHGLVQDVGQSLPAPPIPLQEMQRHALSRSRADAGQTPECLQKVVDQRVAHVVLAFALGTPLKAA